MSMTIHRHGVCCRLYVTLFFLLVLLNASQAQGITTDDKTLSPYFFVESDNPELDQLPLKESLANVTISGVIADVVLEQVYENDGLRPIEAVYLFPASTRAAVHAMKMAVGNRIIEAEIKERKAAEKTYESAKQAGKSASLLEQARPNVFQMRVANILPGDTIRVSLSYTELITPTNGNYEFVLPTVVGPRYNNRSGDDADAEMSWVESPCLHEGEVAAFDFDVTLCINTPIPMAKVTSPSHDIDVSITDPKAARIALSGADAANRDLVVRYRLMGDRIQSGMLAFEGEKENYFLMMMEPPEQVAERNRVSREHLFIVDVSGSMHGFPLDTAKMLMKRILKSITPDDCFNMLLFAGGSELFSSKSLPATKGNIAKATHWIDSMQGSGGTELLPALKRALRLPWPPDTSRIITVVTDGYVVAVEEEAYALVRQNLGAANLFTFGIGTSVNRELIEILARAGAGEPFVVLDSREASAAAKQYQRYISEPVLRSISVRFEGIDAYDVTPISVPDLFTMRPIVLFGKYKGKPNGRILVDGKQGSAAFRATIRFDGARSSSENRPLEYLWARSRIRTLSDQAALGSRPEIQSQITRLGLEYHLMTRYTSFVAVDSVIRSSGKGAATVKQPAPMPAGVSDLAIGKASGALYGILGPNVGYGGLGISGTGRGGGGIGLGAIGHSGGGGSGVGYGRGVGAGGLGGRRGNSPKIRSGASTVKGSLSKEIIRRVIHRHINEIRFCYEKALSTHSDLEGRVVVRFIIASDGTVAKVTLKKSTLNNAAVEQCILTAVGRWRFPPPTDGGTVIVSYPFLLAPPQ
jgi:Ca-activated chloride channel homolog